MNWTISNQDENGTIVKYWLSEPFQIRKEYLNNWYELSVNGLLINRFKTLDSAKYYTYLCKEENKYVSGYRCKK